MESSAWRDESWGDCKRWPVTVLTWCAAEDGSRYEGRRPEKLGHRRLTATYGRQSATMPRRNADDIELRCLLAGRVRRRGTAVLHLADTCRQGEPACNQSAPPPSTNVVDGGVGWWYLYGTVVERWSVTGELSLPALDTQLTGDHLWG